jgi:uncharacterized protein (TIGR03435 family)
MLLAGILSLSISAAPETTQSPPATNPTDADKFEVASIKPNTLGQQSFLWAFRNGRFTARYATLKALIRSAYGRPELVLTERQVIGGPRWLDSERFDVEALAPNVPNSPRGTFSAPLLKMLSRLLEERFSLRTHVETRDFPLFAIVLARQDGRLGPGMRRRAQPCTAATADAPGDSISLGTSTRQTCRGSTGPGTLMGTGLTMSNLASGLSQFVAGIDRIVVDRTGLIGTFDVELHWRPESSSSGQPAAALPDADAPSLFTALEEQLGLKLERTNGTMDVLVIDHVEPLIAN